LELDNGKFQPVDKPKTFVDFVSEDEYEVVVTTGNKPIFLTDEKSALVVTEGVFHIFVADSKDGELIGRRNYLFTLFEGDMLFCVEPTGNKKKQITMFAIGVDESKMAKFDTSKLPIWLNKSQENIEKSQFFLQRLMVWSDRFAYLVKTNSDEDILPISEMNVDVLDYVENGLFQDANKRVFKRLFRMKVNYGEHQKERLEKKRQLGQTYLNKTLAGIKGILNKQEELPEGAVETPLTMVCRKVFKSAGIKMVVPPAVRLKDNIDPVAEIARSSRTRHRHITLKEEWWKKDSGPLIGSLKENNVPVALLPVSSSKYKLYNPITEETVEITKEVAETVNVSVVFLYRPLESKPLKLLDILMYGVKAMSIQDVAVFLGLTLISGWLSKFSPRITYSISNYIIPSGQRNALVDIAVMFFVLSLGMTMLNLVSNFAFQRIESKVGMMLSAAVWDRLMSLPVPFYNQFNSGELSRRAGGIESIRSSLTNVIISSFVSIITGFFHFTEMFRYSSALAWAGIIVSVINVLISVAYSWYNLKMYGQMLGASYFISGMMYQIINGVAKFRVSGAESRALYQWAKAYTLQTRISFKISVFRQSYAAFKTLFYTISNIAFFWIACSGTNLLSYASWMAFTTSYGYVAAAINSISSVVTTVMENVPVFANSKPILQTVPEYDEAKQDPGRLTGEIEVSHLNFRYRQDGPFVLNDVSLKIKRGEYIAIVGASGSGKTTLLRILLGFEKQQSGKIYYNGQDLDGVDLRAVRRQLGVVLQSGQLMTGDILSNIAGANAKLTLKDAEEATKVAGLYSDIAKMPMGMYTLVSEGGGTLSGGQRQRLLIARAVANKPSILYFDEATSALDNKTQAEVIKNLDVLNATRVVIAHRLSTVINCDRILVMHQGRIIEEGNFRQLMEHGGLFAELAKRQMA